jgi:hypothetical protein
MKTNKQAEIDFIVRPLSANPFDMFRLIGAVILIKIINVFYKGSHSK